MADFPAQPKALVRSGTRTSRVLDKIRRERKSDVSVTFAHEGSKPLIDREHTLDAIVRRELEWSQLLHFNRGGFYSPKKILEIHDPVPLLLANCSVGIVDDLESR
jgi:hypothetical protein